MANRVTKKSGAYHIEYDSIDQLDRLLARARDDAARQGGTRPAGIGKGSSTNSSDLARLAQALRDLGVTVHVFTFLENPRAYLAAAIVARLREIFPGLFR